MSILTLSSYKAFRACILPLVSFCIGTESIPVHITYAVRYLLSKSRDSRLHICSTRNPYIITVTILYTTIFCIVIISTLNVLYVFERQQPTITESQQKKKEKNKRASVKAAMLTQTTMLRAR